MSHQHRICAIGLISLASICLTSLRADDIAPRANTRSSLGYFADAYATNRESFSFFTCRFTMTRAKAKSIEDALKGNLTDRMPAKGLWVVDGPNVRYELKSDEKLLDELEKKAVLHQQGNAMIKTIPAGGESQDYISDGIYSLYLDPRFKCANIYPPKVRSPGFRYTPFGMAVMGFHEELNPAALLRRCVKGELQGRYDGKETINGTEVAVLRVGWPGKLLASRFSLDPKRGYLPVQCSEIAPDSDRRMDEAYMTEIKQCSRNRWFPTRTVTIWEPDRKPPFTVNEIKVHDLDVDRRPNADLFRVLVPGGTQLSDPTTNGALINIEQDRRIRASELKKYHDACLGR